MRNGNQWLDEFLFNVIYIPLAKMRQSKAVAAVSNIYIINYLTKWIKQKRQRNLIKLSKSKE